MNRMHLAALTAVIGVIAAGLPAAGAGGQRTDETSHAPGIYLVTTGAGSEDLVRIVGALPHEVKTTGLTKMILSQGLLKGSTHVELAGTVADTRTSSSTPTFRFYFDKAESPSSADPLAALTQVMGGDAMPMGAKTAADFSLVHLTVTEDARQANMGKLGSTAGKPKDTVACVQERLDQGIYSLRPKSPLKPGEYAFFFSNSMGGAGGGGYTAWDFGVDAPK